jgi:hypothetical protein
MDNSTRNSPPPPDEEDLEAIAIDLQVTAKSFAPFAHSDAARALVSSLHSMLLIVRHYQQAPPGSVVLHATADPGALSCSFALVSVQPPASKPRRPALRVMKGGAS